METTKEKILTAISHTISGNSTEEKMDQARKIPIKEISRIGRYTAMWTQPVLVEFYYKSDAMFLLENRSHLPKGVFVNKQFSKETEKERCKLHPILSAARKSENYRGKCQMNGSTLVIKGRNYTSANLHTLPLEINGYMAISKCDAENTTIGFFGELNPLSNFHPTPFKINGYQYHSSDQFIQQQKCKMFGDQETEALIMATESALECKQLSRDIKNFDPKRWKQNAKASCTPGILAKFEQNEQLSHLLQSTGQKCLVECCKDRLWGNGIPLYDSNALNPAHWHSQGLLGDILETVRKLICNSNEPTSMDVGAVDAISKPV